LGAAKINSTLRDGADRLGDWNVVHVCGRGKVAEKANPGLKNVVSLEFVNDIENYIAWADVVVSRAGSNTLCELMALGKPTLFVPLSTGRGDQIENVREMLDKDACGAIFENDLTPETLAAGIERVWANRERLSQNARTAVTDGSKKIFETICCVVRDADHTK
jgi:UDP-N-acetylglucosamine--N-acetylmuramyl-(pentapeptide) pyrophosphoryl-undecaprenol N-acetylglucosamine transferase